MRIGLDYRPALRAVTGIGRYVKGLAGALARTGEVDLSLYGVFFSGNRRAARKAPAGTHLVAWKVPTRLGSLLGADRLLGGCDLFHHTDFTLPRVRRSLPQVMTIHDLAFLAGAGFHTPRACAAMEAVVRGAVQRCRAILVPSEATARDCAEHLGLARERIFVTPLGVDESFFALPPAPPPARPYMLNVATLEPRQNHLRLIRAYLASGVEAELWLAGKPGWICDEVLALARAGAGVRLLGHVKEDRLRELLAGAAAVVYPSLFEGFGLPVLEAMAAGKPVLTTARDPLQSLAGDAALLVDPEDEEALAEGIRRILHDAELRARLSKAGPARARTFTWERCARATLAAYRGVL